jgi:uncharacterized protein (TIGR00725 family)
VPDHDSISARIASHVSQRRVIIGAVGGDRQKDAAKAIGRAVAEAGCILLTGGNPQDSDEVKDAAMVGAASAEAGSSVARLIGILPSHAVIWDDSTDRRLFLHTGLKHNLRNVITGVTPDVVVVFGGSRGTLAEAAFAVAAGKPLFFCHSPTSVDRLLGNFRKHFSEDDNSGNKDIVEYLGKPVHEFPAAWKVRPSVENLKSRLAELLIQASDTELKQTELVTRCIAAATDGGPLGQTGFPGLPGDPTSKARFEAVVERMSL